MEKTYKIEGKIKYHRTWVLAEIDEDLGPYYRALLPRAWHVNPPMAKPHISIVRKFEEPDRTLWKKYDGLSLIIDCFPGVETDGIYYWIDCLSDEVGHVRRSLGLKTFRQDEWSDYNTYHITIGNVK